MSALMEMIKSKKAALQSGRRQKTVKPSDGRSRWRILPSWRGGENDPFWHDFGQHFIKGIDGEIKAVYICTDRTFGRPCSICGAVETAIKATTDDVMVDKLKEAKANARILVNALHIDGDEPTKPQILELAPSVFESICGIIQEWGLAEILDLTAGRDIIVERTGKGVNTKYTVQVAGKPSAVAKETMKHVANLDEYVAQESTEMAHRALSSVAAVAGLLPPAAPAGVTHEVARPAAKLPAGSVTDVEVDETLLAPLAPAAAAAAAPEKAAEAKAAPAAAAVAAPSGEDLEKLLADLG